jgi:hypothetical protein
MPVNLPTFGYVALTESVNKIIKPNTFIKSRLFGREKEHGTKSIQIDIKIGNRKIAPFVKRGKEAVVVGKLGQNTSTVTPPSIRMKKDLDAEDLYFTRGAGLPIHVVGGGADAVMQGRMKRIAEEQADMMDIAIRTSEFMCCRSLLGGYTIQDDEGGFSIDFQMPTDHKPVLEGGAKWDQPDTAKPIENIRLWKLKVKQKTGKVPTEAYMTTDIWNLFIKCAEVKDYLDKRNIKVGEINTNDTILKMGAEKVARIENVDFFVYDELFDGPNGQETMLPSDKFFMAAPNIDSRFHYGAIEDLKSATVVGKYFSKDWITEDPSVYWLLVETHPLPVLHEPEGVVAATVK